jgi:hypothetical protein
MFSRRRDDKEDRLWLLLFVLYCVLFFATAMSKTCDLEQRVERLERWTPQAQKERRVRPSGFGRQRLRLRSL